MKELHQFLDQSRISKKNIVRLRQLCTHANPEVQALAALILDIALVIEGKRRRWKRLRLRCPALFERAVSLLGREYFWCYFIGNGDFGSPVLDAMMEDEEPPGEGIYFEEPPYEGPALEEPPYDGPSFQEKHFEEPGVEERALDELSLEEPWE